MGVTKTGVLFHVTDHGHAKALELALLPPGAIETHVRLEHGLTDDLRKGQGLRTVIRPFPEILHHEERGVSGRDLLAPMENGLRNVPRASIRDDHGFFSGFETNAVLYRLFRAEINTAHAIDSPMPSFQKRTPTPQLSPTLSLRSSSGRSGETGPGRIPGGHRSYMMPSQSFRMSVKLPISTDTRPMTALANVAPKATIMNQRPSVANPPRGLPTFPVWGREK